MTTEELQRKNREILGIEDEEEQQMQTIETPKNNYSSADELMLKNRAIAESSQNTSYASGLVKAEEEGSFIDKEYNRDKLIDYAKTYYNAMANAENEEDYYKNQVLFDKAKKQIQLVSGSGSYLSDFGGEISYGISSAVADTMLTGQKLWNDASIINTSTNIEEFYLKDLYENAGKVRGGNNRAVEESVVQNLNDLVTAYPDDDKIKHLYDTVIDGKYNVPDNYFKVMSSYASEKLKELRYYESNTYKDTRWAKEGLEDLKFGESMSNYSGLGNAVLDATGVVSYMAPSIGVGYLTGGAGGLAGASSGTVGALTQAGTLTSMGLSTYGNTFDRTLAEGYGWNKSGAYASLVAGVEVLSEVIGGESVMALMGGKFSHTLTSGVAQKLISKGKTPLARWMIGIAWDIGAEAIEEMFTEAIDPIFDKAVLGKDISAEDYWLGILESARDSVLPTIIMGGFGKARTISTVSKINNALSVQLDEMAMNDRITKDEYVSMKESLKNWTDDAMAGITEHYEEIKNELGKIEYTEDYETSMKNMFDTLNQRNEAIPQILQYASNLEQTGKTLTEVERQSLIEKYAENYNIDKTKLQEIFANYKDVLPETYRQVERSAKAYSLTNSDEDVNNAKTNIAQATQNFNNAVVRRNTQQAISAQIEQNKQKEKVKIDKKNSNPLFVKLAKNSPAQKTESGVIRLDVNDSAPVQKFNLGNVDSKNKPTYKEIMNSPILVQEYKTPDDATERSKINVKQYVYNNFADFQKDMVNRYGSIFNTRIRAITMSGKGGYEMQVANNGDITWERGGVTIRNTDRKSLNKSQNVENNKSTKKSKNTLEDSIDKNKKTLYNQSRGVERKQNYAPGEIHASLNISFGETEQVRAEAWENRKDEQDGLHYIDLSKNGYYSYIYERNGLSIEPIVQLRGHENILNYIRKKVEDGSVKKYGDAHRWSATFRREFRDSNSNSSSLQYGRKENKNDDIYGRKDRQQRKDFRKRTVDESKRNSQSVKDSNQGSFFDAKTENPRPLNKNPRNYLQELIDNPTSEELIDNPISKMYKESAMERKNSPIIEATDAINRGDVPREEGRSETALAEITNMIKHFLRGTFGKLRGSIKGRAYGTYNRDSGYVRVGEISNVSTAFHELGHYLHDTLLNNKTDFDADIKKELKNIAESRWKGKYTGKVRIMEGFAEATRMWVEDRNNFIKKYPAISEMFVTVIEDEDTTKEAKKAFKFLDELRNKVIDYENMTSLQKFESLRKNFSTPVTIDHPVVHFITQATKNIFNDAVYADKLDRFVAKQLNIDYNNHLHVDRIGSLLKVSGNSRAIADQLHYGIVDFNTGKKITHGFKEITESVLPTKEQAQERGTKVKKLWEQNIDDVGEYAQLKRIEYLYESERDVNNLGTRYQETKDAIKEILDRTALTKEQLDNAVNMINEDSQTLINYAYEKHKISAEQRDQLLSDNQFYAPLNRIVEEIEGNMIKNGGTNGFKNNSFYHLKGSDLQLENPFVALANNWGRIIRSVETNNVYLKMAELAKRIKDAGGEYGLWFDMNVAPVVKQRGEERLEDFKEVIRGELRKLQEKNPTLNLLYGDIVDNMDFSSTISLFGLEYIDKAERIISYEQDGVRKYIQFADNDWGRGLFNLVAGLDVNSGNVFTDFLQELNAPLKMGATGMNMEFALGNMQSDAMMRYITSDANFINRVYFPVITNVVNVINYLRNRRELLPNWNPSGKEATDMYRKFVQSGVAQSGKYVSNLENLRKNKEDVFGDATGPIFNRVRKQKGFGKPSEIMSQSKLGQFLAWIPEVSEQATRFAEFCAVYKKMKADGATEEVAIREAGMKARLVTQDFTVQGKWLREINKVIPFASATVGGLYRMEQEARNHPERFTIRMAGLGAFALLISSLMRGDDRDWYDELNAQKKFDNFILPNPTGDRQHPLIIKKPQGPARAFVNLVQYMYDAGMGYMSEDEAGDKFKEWLLMAYQEVNPVNDVSDFVPGALIGFIENRVNYDFYYKTPIVSQDLQKLDPRHQYDEYTSETAKAIGNIFNWSPKKIDNAYEQWFAGTGKQLRSISDWIIKTATGTKDTLPAKDKSEYTFASRIFANAYKNPASVDALYKQIEKLENEKAEGRMTVEQQEEYNNLQTAKTIMSQYKKQIEGIKANNSLTPSEKRKEVDKVQELRVDTARYYLGKKLLNSSNESNIKLAEFYPSSDTYKYKNVQLPFTDEAIKKEYAEMFQKEYEANIEELIKTSKYKNATEEEKLEMEKDEKKKARTATTNKMKQIVYNRTK